MRRYIDAELLIETMQKRYDEICDTYGYHDLYASGYDDGVDAVENAPTANVAPIADTVRKMVERLKDKSSHICTVNGVEEVVDVWWIDQIAKEMLEDST